MNDTPQDPELQAEINLAIEDLRSHVLKMQADGHRNQAIAVACLSMGATLAVVDGQYRWMEREFEIALKRLRDPEWLARARKLRLASLS